MKQNNFFCIHFLKGLELPTSNLGSFLQRDDIVSILSPFELTYLSGLYFYLIGDQIRLSQCINDIKETDEVCIEKVTVKLLLKARQSLRNHQMASTYKIIDELQKTHIDNKYLAEKYFILARLYESLAILEESQQYYLLAADAYQVLGCYSKQLKSQFNALVCREQNLDHITIKEYQSILVSAIQQRNRVMVGVILNNISHRLMHNGAYSSALYLAKKSLSFLSIEKLSFNYQIAEMNYYHILAIMDFKEKAINGFSQKLDSQFIEIQSTAKLFLKLTTEINQLTVGWKRRLQNNLLTHNELSELEDRIIGFLSLKNRSKQELCSYLWPAEHFELEIKEARLKRVLARLRKKRIKLVEYEQKVYKLVLNPDNQYLDANEKNNYKSLHLPAVDSSVSGDEAKLIDLLKNQELTSIELIENIYASNLNSLEDFVRLSNRLKNLVARVRSKFPHKLIHRGGKYIWAS